MCCTLVHLLVVLKLCYSAGPTAEHAPSGWATARPCGPSLPQYYLRFELAFMKYAFHRFPFTYFLYVICYSVHHVLFSVFWQHIHPVLQTRGLLCIIDLWEADLKIYMCDIRLHVVRSLMQNNSAICPKENLLYNLQISVFKFLNSAVQVSDSCYIYS